MATDTAAKAVHNTLSTTVADKVTITGYDRVAIVNKDASQPLYVSWNGTDTPTTAVAAANDTEYVAPGGFIEIDAGGTGGGAVSVVGSGNAYGVIGLSS